MWFEVHTYSSEAFLILEKGNFLKIVLTRLLNLFPSLMAIMGNLVLVQVAWSTTCKISVICSQPFVATCAQHLQEWLDFRFEVQTCSSETFYILDDENFLKIVSVKSPGPNLHNLNHWFSTFRCCRCATSSGVA